MNTTSADSSGLLSSYHIGGYGYGIGVSIGVILLILTITFASYFCTRIPEPAQRHNRHRSRLNPHPDDPINQDVVITVADESEGLDEETILSYPKLEYSEAKMKMSKASTSSCCSICLADYKSSDMLRLLPDCDHLFHVKCVDPWLRLHPTCPVCRTSPLPTPMATPLAEVVPLASRPY